MVAAVDPGHGADSALPLRVDIHNDLPGEIALSTFTLIPNEWNGETSPLTLLDVSRDGALPHLTTVRPKVEAPSTISGMGGHRIAPGSALSLRTDLRKWSVDGGWSPGTYRAIVRVERLVIDGGRCHLSIESAPFEFEIAADRSVRAVVAVRAVPSSAAAPDGRSSEEPSLPPSPSAPVPDAALGLDADAVPVPGAVSVPDAAPGTATHAALPTLETLRVALLSGTPLERQAALQLVRDLQAVRLIPEVIQLIEDATPLPRQGDTGWGFVGHQAASVMGTLAVAIDRPEMTDRETPAFSFHDDQYKGGEALRAAGRLKEVRLNWDRWWGDQLNPNRAPIRRP